MAQLAAQIVSHDDEFRRRMGRLLRSGPIPVSVPPEPMPHTTASTRRSICSQISGAVPYSWASGLAGLAN